MIQTVSIFLVVLVLIVFVHEFGHFFAAKKLGMRVYEFAIGFPPFLGGVYKDPKTKKLVFVSPKKAKAVREASQQEQVIFPATLYSLNILPLGGFVRIKGENGEEGKDSDSFAAQKVWKRVVVLVAGVCMNYILAGVLLGVGYMMGLPTDITTNIDSNAIVVEEPQVIIGQVQPDSPAKQAGLLAGDTVMSVNGEVPANSEALKQIIARQGQEDLSLTIKRHGQVMQVQVSPTYLERLEDQVRLGVLLADAAVVRYPWYIAIWKGFVAATTAVITIAVSFFLLIKNILTGNGLLFAVSGPVGIATVVGESARQGFNYLINVTAMISLSLAVINILPFPALDGGRLLFVVLEKFRGKPVAMKYEQIAHTVGFVLLLLVLVLVTIGDIRRLF